MNRNMSRGAGSRFAGKNIVIIGGGTGTSTLLKGLKKYSVNLSVIVSTADDGGSSGILRKKLGVLPPGDIRQCLVALAQNEKFAQILAHRITSGKQKGHTVGNLIIASLEKETGSPEKAIELAASFLETKGQVIPVTLKPTNLSVKLENGKIIRGEHKIDEPRKNLESRILNLELKPRITANPKAVQAIKEADLIVFGPGDLYTSTIPNLLVKGVSEALNKSKATKVLVSNIMTKNGQTNGFTHQDFVRELEKYSHGKINVLVANTKKPTTSVLNLYKKEKAEFIEPNVKNISVKVVLGNFLSQNIFVKSKEDKLKRSLVRHDSKKLAKIIYNLV